MTDNNGTTVVSSNGASTLEIAQSDQDLLRTKSSRKKRNWIVAIVVGAIVVALIIAAVALLSKGQNHHQAEKQTAETINLEEFLSYRYIPRIFNGTWVSGDTFLYRNDDADVLLYNIRKKTNTILLYANDSIVMDGFNFEISADNQYLLVAHNYQKLYRYSYKARYTIINLSSPATRKDLTMGNNSDFLLVEWAPVGNGLVYIFENNIYYKASAESGDYVTLTASSKTDFITNGIPDWVYEEEVFSSNKAVWFSGDGKKLAYARFNDTEVNIMVVPIYGDPGNLRFQYPRAMIVKYPKAGTPNPIVDLFVYNIESKETTLLETTGDLKAEQPILSTVTWTTNNSVLAVWMNRVQNQADVVVYQDLSKSPTIIKSIKKSNGWVELFVPPIVSQTGTHIALLLSKDEGPKAGSYRHLALLEVKESAIEVFLTGGTYVVSEVLGWNHGKNLIFYTATTPNDSSVQHLYSVSPTTKITTCLSCPLKSKKGNRSCLYNSAEVSTDSSYLIFKCNGPDVPYISILSSEGKELLQWTTNEELVELLAGKSLPGRAKFEFNIAGGFTAKVMLKLPPNMDMSGNTKYPMLVNVYGGPDTFQVIDSYNLDWGSYLASNKSIIYATIDGRSSGLRGDNLLFAGYRKLGTVEVIDQINVTKLIQQNVPYVDPSRTAIWGWSYGGYVAGMALATDTDNIFKCGISVAPVTDWALYDSIYTERFMGLPNEDNYEGYVQAQLLTKYAGLKDKQYFLIHGTFDDNVHYQQSMMWAKVLETHDILFRQLSYTDEDHSLSNVRPHLYHSLEKFLNECFAKDS